MVIGSSLIKAQTGEYRSVKYHQVTVDGRFVLTLQAFPVLDYRILIDDGRFLHRRRFRRLGSRSCRFPF